MIKCNKCWMLKIWEKSKCACNAKPFNEKKLEVKKPIAQISEKKKERLQNNWTEIELFKKKFDLLKLKKQNICVVTWKEITYDEESWEWLDVSMFAHILPKWKFPQYRYCLNNIALVNWIDEHHLLDEAVLRMKDDIWLIELERLISSWIEINIKPYL